MTSGPAYVLVLFMSDAMDIRAREIREREDRLLVEMTDLAAELARDFAAEAKQAKADGDKDQAERCTAAFDRMARSVRLSIALRRKLERVEAREAALRRSDAVDLRKARLRARLRSEINASGHGFSDRLEMERELDARLAEDALYQSFLARPLDQAIAKFRSRLGLSNPPPQGEGDRVAVEGVETHVDRRGLQPPHRPAAGVPPEVEHLRDLKPAPS